MEESFLLAVHAPGWLTVPAGIGAVTWLVWYWLRLGRAGVPQSRRRIRRTSLVVIFVGLIVIVRAVSFIDERVDPTGYTVTWAMAILLVLILLFIAFIDLLNNLRLHRNDRERALLESRERLARAIADAAPQR